MNKFKKIREKLKNDYMLFQNYGFNFAKDDFELQFIYRNPKSEKTKKKIRIKHERVIKYLKSNYLEYIERNRKETDESEYIEENCNIYIFWWQGFENAPDIVKSCLNSVKNNRGMHKIILIDKNNYDQYIKLPDYIIDKLNKNIISLTHFSDILRVSLLYKYGGIWLDATIFLKNVLDKSIYNYKLYTVKHQLYKDFHVCRGMWTDSCFMAGKNNLLMKYLRNFFFEYWKKENYLITYLLIDCIISIAYDTNTSIRKMLDDIPVNNVDIFEIENNLCQIYSKKIFDMEHSNTYIYKTSYKRNVLNEINGEKTFYKMLLMKGTANEETD